MFFNKDSDGKGGPPGAKRRTVPLLPLRDIIVFPHMVSQLFVGRERSINALDAAMARDKDIFLAAQKNAKTNEPTPDDIFQVGTLGTVMQLLRLPDGTVKVLVEGKRRARIKRFAQTDEFFLVEVEEIAEAGTRGVEVEALMRSVQAAFEMYVKLNKKVQPEVLMSVQTIDDPARLSDTIVANLPTIKLADRQQLLEMEDASQAPRTSARADAGRDRDSPGGEEDPVARQEADGEDAEGVLPERADAGHPEGAGWRRARRVQERDPGDRGDAQDQADEQGGLREGQEGAQEAEDDAPDERRGDRRAQLHRLDHHAPLVRQDAKRPTTSKKAEEILEEDHYGLKKIKERILEYLAVQALTKKLKGPVLCFVGPPGVGKTSLAKSIARATGRKFVRLSLGGVRDEAEIRGHRRTYIGAMPGKLIQSLRKVGDEQPRLPARRGRQDVDRLPRRSRRRRCSRCSTPSRTTASTTTTSTSTTTSRT